MSVIATIDLSAWRAGGPAADDVAAEVDAGLQRAGFILVRGHGVDPALARDVRAAAREFFALTHDVKSRYSVPVGGRGWIGPGAEANAYAEGTETPPDLKESFSLGAETTTGDPDVDRFWFAPNVWPQEVPALQSLVGEYTTQMRRVADDLLALFAHALQMPQNPFAALASRPTWTMNINHYPPVSVVGDPEPGQFRIGPHTDFGSVTILDRQPGTGCLQVQDADGDWHDAEYVPGSLTINVGDLLEMWSGGRWRSSRHRVLPPSTETPEEGLMSLVFFGEPDDDTIIAPLLDGDAFEPVRARDFLEVKIAAITV